MIFQDEFYYLAHIWGGEEMGSYRIQGYLRISEGN